MAGGPALGDGHDPYVGFVVVAPQYLVVLPQVVASPVFEFVPLTPADW